MQECHHPAGSKIEIPLLSAEWSREPVFPFIAVEIEQTQNTSPSKSNPNSKFTSFRSYIPQPPIIPNVTIYLPDDAQVNANGGLRRLLGDVKHTLRVRYRSFSEWSMQGPDEGRVFTIVVETAREAVHDVETMRTEIENGFLGNAEESDLWQRLAKWEIKEALIAIGRMEKLRREWAESADYVRK